MNVCLELKRAVCHTLQDTMNKLYAASSIADRGTMCQLKNDFNHRNVTTTVMKSFNYNDNFVRFTTKAHVVYTCCCSCTNRATMLTRTITVNYCRNCVPLRSMNSGQCRQRIQWPNCSTSKRKRPTSPTSGVDVAQVVLLMSVSKKSVKWFRYMCIF